MSENKIEIINQREVELLEKNRKINLQKLFTPEGMNSIIAEITKETSDFSADISTKEGRAKIISMAAKIAKCKTPIKNLAMELKEESKRLIDGVNLQYNRYEAAMDDLRDKIRKPVDEIEEREAASLRAKQERLAKIDQLKSLNLVRSEDIQLKIEELKELKIFEWEDFLYKAATLIEEVWGILITKLAAAKKYEADQFELAQLKKEKAEREQKDHEAKIAEEAAKNLANNLKAEKERFEQEKQDLEQIAKDRIIQARIHSLRTIGLILEAGNFIFRNIIIEFYDVDNLEDLEWEKLFKTVSQRVSRIKEFEVLERTRKAIEEEQRKEREATERREANINHRAKINNQALEKIKNIIEIMPFSEALIVAKEYSDKSHDWILAKAIIEAIIKGEIPHIQINY